MHCECRQLLTKHLLQCEAAKQEVLSLVSQTLTRNFPDRFQLKNTILQNIATGEDFELADQDRNPMDVVARLVQVRLYWHPTDWVLSSSAQGVGSQPRVMSPEPTSLCSHDLSVQVGVRMLLRCTL